MIDITQITEWEYINYVIAVLIVFLAFLVARICLYIFEVYLNRFAAKTNTKLDDMIIGAIKRPLYIIIFVFGVYLAFNYVDFPFSDFVEVTILFKIISVILITWVAFRLSDAIIKEYGYALAKKTDSNIDDVIIPVVDQISGILIIIIGILLILNLLEIRITPMLAGMGIAGIAVALAAQDTLSNMFSGFAMMVDQPFKLGDRIILDSGELCEVKEIGLRSTRLYNVIDHAIITMPNSDVSNMKITNISAPDVKLKVRIPIGVGYGTDIDKVKQILLEIAEEAPDVLNFPPPEAPFMEFDDSSLNLLLIVWIGNIRKKVDVIDYINCRIKTRFEEEGINIPFPIRTVYLERED